MMQTPYTAQIKMDGDSWVVKQKSREYQTLVSMRSSIYFNYKAICLFKGITMNIFILKVAHTTTITT